MKKRIAVLISNAGTGTNLQAIIDAIKKNKLNAEIVVVVSDTADAYGLVRAKKQNINTLIINNKIGNLTKILKDKYKVDFIALAGWKKIIPNSMIKSFSNGILNIHPGLIPDSLDSIVKNPDGTDGLWNRGKFTDAAIKKFLANKSSYAGSSVNFLTHEFDFGPVLARCFEKILKNDTVESLYKRLKKKENKIYIDSLKKICN
jgi:phosphoribosylglycinamide formyltransferase 1